MKRKVNYKMGALKRRFKTGKVDIEPGTFINQSKAQKVAQNKARLETPISLPMRISIMGA